jgi:type III secretory pathway component EscU
MAVKPIKNFATIFSVQSTLAFSESILKQAMLGCTSHTNA